MERVFSKRGVVVWLSMATVLATGGVAAPPIERFALFDAAETNKWSIAESSLKLSDEKAPDGSPALHWHVTVDHTAGEIKYPIGWPRFGRAIPEGAAQDWSPWDSLHFWLRADTTRPALPREPVGLGLYTPDKTSAFQRPLTELLKGVWVELDIPLREIARHHDVRQIQFHIAESKYAHGDQLDLLVAGPELRRAARPTLLEFSAERAVMFADAPVIPLRFRVSGVKTGEFAQVVAAIRTGDKSVFETTLHLGRGEHRIELDTKDARLAPGEYQIEATIKGDQEKKTGNLRLIQSPWAK